MTELKEILLVEDNPRDIELTLEALSGHKLVNRITIVNDGVEALEYLRCEGKYKDRLPTLPAVVIADIKMPRMGGIELLRAIRRDERLKRLPVVMLTSSREEEDIIRSYDHGTNAYIVKPMQFSDFIKAIETIGVFWALLNELPPMKGVKNDQRKAI